MLVHQAIGQRKIVAKSSADNNRPRAPGRRTSRPVFGSMRRSQFENSTNISRRARIAAAAVPRRSPAGGRQARASYSKQSIFKQLKLVIRNRHILVQGSWPAEVSSWPKVGWLLKTIQVLLQCRFVQSAGHSFQHRAAKFQDLPSYRRGEHQLRDEWRLQNQCAKTSKGLKIFKLNNREHQIGRAHV